MIVITIYVVLNTSVHFVSCVYYRSVIDIICWGYELN